MCAKAGAPRKSAPIARAALPLLLLSGGLSAPRAQVLVDSIQVDWVPAGFPVGFDLLTSGDRQYIAYYDSAHDMVVASRRLDSAGLSRQVLPTRVGWDPHNRVVLELDDQGHLHVSGNMHAVPLVYFRTSTPWEAKTLARVDRMVSSVRESRVTYPGFFRLPAGQLYFSYRQGSSGDGVWYYNKYDSRPGAETWSALHGGAPLFGNEGSVNAYFTGGKQPGPDGRFHIAYLWRDTPAAETCHDLGYLRTRDGSLDAWETIDGTPLTLPITIRHQAPSVDPSPIRQGLTNMSNALGFDARNRPILSYHKYDAAGVSQAYNARWSEASRKWEIVQASDWKGYTWAFAGSGSIPREITLEAVEVVDGKLTQRWVHPKLGSGRWILDGETLRPVATLQETPEHAARAPATASTPERSAAPDLERHFQWGRGKSGDASKRFALRWETLPANRGLKPDPVPPDSRLMLLEYRMGPAALADATPSPSGRQAGRYQRRVGRMGFRAEPNSASGQEFDGLGKTSNPGTATRRKEPREQGGASR